MIFFHCPTIPAFLIQIPESPDSALTVAIINTKLNREKLKAIPLKSGTRQGFPVSLSIFNIVLEVLANAIKQLTQIKKIQVGKEEVNVSLFAYDMKLYISDPKHSDRKLLHLILIFYKVVEYEVN
ncbi:hypothetical protein STEG23_015803 [Scotinomys teguina]